MKISGFGHGLAAVLLSLCASTLAGAQGEASYQSRCALCHGSEAEGTDRAPSIIATLQTSATDRLASIITEGVASKGMPAIEIPADELGPLLTFLKALAAAASPGARDPRAPTASWRGLPRGRHPPIR